MAPRRELLLLRHGIAEDRALGLEDAQRPLTPRGRERTAKVLERLVALGLAGDAMVSSPLVRAFQTAELAVAAGLADGFEPSTALAPGGQPEPLLERLGQRLILVGHEPDLSELAAQLCGAPAGCLRLRKAGVILLELPQAEGEAFAGPGARAILSLLLSPRSLGL
ncbi:MAG: histidine phosphatase family protein [Synechococcaceae cyanobacterium ELA445]